MSIPKLNSTPTDQEAKAAGLPVINNRQTVGMACRGGIYCYFFSDSTKVVQDATGKAAVWPE